MLGAQKVKSVDNGYLMLMDINGYLMSMAKNGYLVLMLNTNCFCTFLPRARQRMHVDAI